MAGQVSHLGEDKRVQNGGADVSPLSMSSRCKEQSALSCSLMHGCTWMERGLMGSRKVEGNNWGSFGSFLLGGKTRVTG